MNINYANMEFLLAVMALMIFAILITDFLTKREIGKSLALFSATIALGIFINELYINTEKNTEINCINGHFKYKKVYIYSTDSTIIDSIYILKKDKYVQKEN